MKQARYVVLIVTIISSVFAPLAVFASDDPSTISSSTPASAEAIIVDEIKQEPSTTSETIIVPVSEPEQNHTQAEQTEKLIEQETAAVSSSEVIPEQIPSQVKTEAVTLETVPVALQKVLISKVRLGEIILDPNDASKTIEKSDHEFIELQNPSDESVNLNGWRLEYVTASGATTRLLATLSVTLEPQSSYVLAHSNYNLSDIDGRFGTTSDGGMLAKTGGTVRLVSNVDAKVIDMIGWGSAKLVETKAAKYDAAVPMQRCADNQGSLVDTDDNLEDLKLYDEYVLRGNVACQQPVDGVVLVNDCAGIVINEIVPNVETTQQFIEVKNTLDRSVSLLGCALMTNRSSTAQYIFPELTLQPGGYHTIYISDTTLTLTKTTTGTVYILASDKQTEVDSRQYDAIKENAAWAQFEDDWRQTFAFTANQENVWQEFLPCNEGYERNLETGRCRQIAQVVEAIDCGEGRERNAETNRCRNIVVAQTLVACNPGQYRNPDTGRCRALATSASTLKPCTADQYRNEETNRCRKITTTTAAAGLAACKEGQERNPDTNRCRNVTSLTSAPYGIENTPTPDSVKFGWVIAALVGVGALGYVVYEWRSEIARGVRSMLQKSTDK